MGLVDIFIIIGRWSDGVIKWSCFEMGVEVCLFVCKCYVRFSCRVCCDSSVEERANVHAFVCVDKCYYLFSSEVIVVVAKSSVICI